MKAADKLQADKQRASASRSRKLATTAATTAVRNEKQQAKRSTTVKSSVPAASKTPRASRDLKTATVKDSKRDARPNELNRTYKKEDLRQVADLKQTAELKKTADLKQAAKKSESAYESDFESDDEPDKGDDVSLQPASTEDNFKEEPKNNFKVDDLKVKNGEEKDVKNGESGPNAAGNGHPDPTHATTTKLKRTERPETSQVTKIRTTIELQKDLVYQPNRAKELLDIISLNTAMFEIVNLEPIDYQDFMDRFGQVNTKQVGLQSTESRDAEVQLETQSNVEHKQIQTSAELDHSKEDHYNYSTEELFRLKKFLFKAESILNQLLLAQTKSNEISQAECRRFGRLLRLDSQFNQLITFHEFRGYGEDPDEPKTRSSNALSNTLAVFWYQNQISQLLYCREKVSSNLAIESGLYVLGTENGTLLIYDLTDRNQNKSNLNLPDLRIAGVDKRKLVSSSFSTLFLQENLHKSPVVKLSSLQSEANFKKIVQLFSLDECGNLLIWHLEKMKNPNLSLDSKLSRGMSPLSNFKLSLYESLDLKSILSGQDYKLAVGFTFSTFERANNSDGNFDYLLPALDQSGELRVLLFENKTTLKKSFKLPVNLTNNVLSIDFCPSDPTLFLVASSDGTLTLFDREITQALYVWQQSPGIRKANWLKCQHFYCFVVLETSNRILVFDLNHELHRPVQSIEAGPR